MRRHRRGFATIVAILLLGLLTAAVAAVASAGVADARRTRRVTTDAQLRQLLLAAGADVAARAGRWGDAPTDAWSVAVPASLRGYVVHVQARPGPTGNVEVTMTANGEGQHARQRMTWARAGDGWGLVDVSTEGL